MHGHIKVFCAEIGGNYKASKIVGASRVKVAIPKVSDAVIVVIDSRLSIYLKLVLTKSEKG